MDYYIAKRTGREERVENTQTASTLIAEYQVIIPDEDRMLGPQDVLLRTVGLPIPGAPIRHANRILRVNQHTVTRSAKNRDLFYVSVRWQWPVVPAIKDPTNEFFPPTFGSWKRQVALVKDAQTGALIANSAGAPPAQFPMVDQGDPTISWKRVEAWWNQGYADLFWDRVNNAPIAIFGKTYATGTVKCESIVGTPEYRMVDMIGSGETLRRIFYDCVYSFSINRNGWKYNYVDAGGAVKKNGKLVAPVLADGSPAAEAVLLDGSGGQLADNADPVYLSAWEYQSADFSLLNLPAFLPQFILE